MSGKRDIIIQNITIHRFDRRSVIFAKSTNEESSSIVLKRLRIYGNLDDDTLAASQLNRGYSLNIENVDDLIIKDCYFYDTYGGMYLKDIKNAIIEGNHFERVNYGNIAINKSIATKVIGNTLIEPGKGSRFESGHGDGISLVGKVHKNLLIDSNRIANGYCYGLWATASLEHSTISNNAFEKGVTTALAISGDYTKDITVRDNVFNSNLASGILFNGKNIKKALVKNNIFIYDKVVKGGGGKPEIILENNTFFKKPGHKMIFGPFVKNGNNKQIDFVKNPTGQFGLKDSNDKPIKLGDTYSMENNILKARFTIKNEGNVPLELQGFPQVILSSDVLPSGHMPDGARGERESGQSCFLDLCVLSREQPNVVVLMPNETSSFVVTKKENSSSKGEVIVNMPRSVPAGKNGESRSFESFWFKIEVNANPI